MSGSDGQSSCIRSSVCFSGSARVFLWPIPGLGGGVGDPKYQLAGLADGVVTGIVIGWIADS